MDEATAIEFVDVHTSLGDNYVLRGVSFALPRDHISVLIGPSGAGKSTCISHLTGLRAPDAGKVLVDGRSVWGMRASELNALRRRSGVLLQGTAIYGSGLFASLTALDNVYLQLRATTDLDESHARARARDRLREVGLGDHADVLPDELSAGMRKRLALARATAADPDFVVLDAFELGIDGVRLGKLCTLVRARQRDVGGTYLVVTQDMDVARRLADRVVVLADGRVLAQGPAPAILQSSDIAIHQLVSGSRAGPLKLADEHPARGGRPPAPPAASEPYDLPPWLVGAVLLVAVTASALVLGAGEQREIAAVIALWILTAIAVVIRSRGAGR